MRPIWILLAAAVINVVACSPREQQRATNDIKSAAADLPGTVRDGTNSAHGAEFQASVKDLAKATGTAVKEGAKETKESLDKQVSRER